MNNTPNDSAPLNEDLVDEWNRALLSEPAAQAYLLGRYIALSLVEEFQLGWDGHRIIVPVRDSNGLLVNARRYKAKSKPGEDKMLNTKGWGSPTRLNFISSIARVGQPGYYDWLIVAGGEWDALSAIGQGIPAVCGTNGEGNLPRADDLALLRDQRVALLLDNDDAGRSAAQKWAKALVGISSETRVVELR